MLPLPSLFSFLLPEQASTIAPDVDAIFNFIMGLSIFIFIVLMGATIYFLVRYRSRQKGDLGAYITHHDGLEIVWTIIPTIVFVAISIWGWRVYHTMANPPKDAMVIHVQARKWSWGFTYASGHQTTNNLYVPIDKKVVLDMTSNDVIHSFFVPSFRVKKDVVPGMRTKVWFEATKEGEFRILCAEFCGTNHSKMVGTVHVLSAEKYSTWQKQVKSASTVKKSLSEMGRELFMNRGGCIACHSIDGKRGAGPSLKGLWGNSRQFSDGTSIKSVDAQYIRESLMNPRAKEVKGYSSAMMPPFQGQLTEAQITQLIEFIKTVK